MTQTIAAQQLSAEQEAVFNRIEHTNQHLFVTGRAGTGKSTILNYLTENTGKNIAVCAPTGVAALNVYGQTIHSLLRLPIGVIADQGLEVRGAARKLLASIDTLVIDEISMVSADLMDAINRVLRIARRSSAPFGGVQIVMFGDPFQLPPVPPRDAHERAYFADTYRSLWFFDSKVWQQTPLEIIELVTVHRQSDSRFKQLLGAVRHGAITEAELQELNAAGAAAPHAEALTLATTNAKVAEINAGRLAALPGEVFSSRARVSGSFSSGAHPADEDLRLKVGAQVMFVRNDPDGRWVNGTIGTVKSINRREVYVSVAGSPGAYLVERVKWDRYAYQYDSATQTLRKSIAASFEQLPLRLAWAVTVHKSQGHTYDEATIDIGNRAFSAGQTYVALSRLQSLEGLRLSRPLELADIIVDPDVVRFMSGRTSIAA